MVLCCLQQGPIGPKILSLFEGAFMKRLLVLLLSLSLASFSQGKGKGHNGHNSRDNGDTSYRIFSTSQQNVIRGCLNDTSSLPPGLAKRESLPPGLQKQLQKNGKLPPGMQKK